MRVGIVQRELTEVLLVVRVCLAWSRCPASIGCLYGWLSLFLPLSFLFPSSQFRAWQTMSAYLINAKTESRSSEILLRVLQKIQQGDTLKKH